MEGGRSFRTLVVAALLLCGFSLFAQTADKPTESKHCTGPHSLEAWTLNSPVPDSNYGDEQFAFTLVLGRNGRVLHRIKGDPMIWRWIFWADGRQLAYETGPFHFSMTCVLVDVKTGHRIADFDCYHELSGNAPAWVSALESSR